jgi:membrane protein DedA with SNARE-associated domain
MTPIAAGTSPEDLRSVVNPPASLDHAPTRTTTLRPVLIGIAAARFVLSVVALFLAPWLYRDHLAGLVALRPTKEVLLFAGYQVRNGNVFWPVVAVAAIPILIISVWVFYALGKSYRDDLDDADLPGIAGRMLPRDRVTDLRETVTDQGWTFVFLGRLAVMPSTLVAAAAGTSDMSTRTFLLADTAGAIVSGAMLLTAGFLLGETYETAGPWFTALGAVVMVGLLVLLGRRLRARH